MANVGPGKLGALLRSYREARGLLQEELAAIVEPTVSVNTISNVERGRTRPYRRTLDALAAALELDAGQRSELLNAWRGFAVAARDGDAFLNWPPSADGAALADGVTRTRSPAERRPHTLPEPATRLIGREPEVATLVARLLSPEVRLLTLTGPGGIGKTRLALEAAEELFEACPDGAFFVSLAPTADSSLVVAAIAQALGLPDAGPNLRDRLCDFLRDKRMLLVLDNFEHLLPAVGLLSWLLAQAPRIKVLVTSREVLRLSGEYVLEVPPLRLPVRSEVPVPERLIQYEAVRLFIERAAAAQANFRLSDSNAPAVAEICRRLEGLPLAIELAAARVRHIAPEDLLTRLERRLSVLTNGPRDLPLRQQTLRSAIGWSYDLLTPDEQAIFRRMAVFVGGFTFQGIETVCSWLSSETSISLLDRIGSLIDKSLVRYESRPANASRYTMLETVREYGLEQLAATGEEPVVRARHTAYYEQLVQQAAPHFLRAEQLEWLARTDDELDNLRAALRWLLDHHEYERGQLLAGSLWFFWSIHGRASEGREWLTRLLGDAGHATSARARAQALFALGFAAQRQYDLGAAAASLSESIVLARRAGDAHLAAMAQVRFGVAIDTAEYWESSPSPSLRPRATGGPVVADPGALFEEALRTFRQLGDEWGMAMCLHFYSRLILFTDFARSKVLANELHVIANRLGERWALVQALRGMSVLALESGELDAARRFLHLSLHPSEQLNDWFEVGQGLARLAQLEMDSSRFSEALAVNERRAASYRLLGNRRRLAQALHDLGIAARLAGALDRARGAFDESLALSETLDQSDEVNAVHASFGHLHLACGAPREAASKFTRSLRGSNHSARELSIATALSGVGRMLLDADQRVDTGRLLGAAESVLERLRTSPGSADLRPSRTGPQRYQFQRDLTHVRELRIACRDASAAESTTSFQAALETGRSLGTSEAIALALSLLEDLAASQYESR
jgi:predicted ATPase/transcriptional regulator with XRE-family HTH domain